MNQKRKVGRPKGRKPESNNIPITFKVSAELKKQLADYCRRSGNTQGDTIRTAIKEHIKDGCNSSGEPPDV